MKTFATEATEATEAIEATEATEVRSSTLSVASVAHVFCPSVFLRFPTMIVRARRMPGLRKSVQFAG